MAPPDVVDDNDGKPEPWNETSEHILRTRLVEMQEEDDDQAQKLINEGEPELFLLRFSGAPANSCGQEYKTWKKNSPFLYDMILR